MYKICIKQNFNDCECITYMVFNYKTLQIINIHKQPRRWIKGAYHVHVDAFKILIANLNEQIKKYILELIYAESILTVKIEDTYLDWSLFRERIKNQYKLESHEPLIDGDYEIIDYEHPDNKHKEYALTANEYMILRKKTYRSFPSSMIEDICILIILSHNMDIDCSFYSLPREIIIMIINILLKKKDNIYDWIGLK
jgi:hypothetical protein